MKKHGQHFLKESEILVKYCKVPGCTNYMYRPRKGEWHTRLGLCATHRRIYYRDWHLNHFMPWFKKQPPEVQDKYRMMKKENWDRWVTKNIDKRRAISLKSYHKNRHQINKKRRAVYRKKVKASRRSP